MSTHGDLLDFDEFGSDLDLLFSPGQEDKKDPKDNREVSGSGTIVPMDTGSDSLIDLPVPPLVEEGVKVKTVPFVKTEMGYIERTIDTRAFGTFYHAALNDLLKIHAGFAHHESGAKRVAWSRTMQENKMDEVRRKSKEAYDNLIAAIFLDRNVKFRQNKKAEDSPAFVAPTPLVPPEPETCACVAVHAAISMCPKADKHVSLCESVTQKYKRDIPFLVPKSTFAEVLAERRTLLPVPTPKPTTTQVREERGRWVHRGRGGKRRARSISSTQRQPPKPQEQPQPSTSGYRPKPKRGRYVYYQDTRPQPQTQQQQQKQLPAHVPFRPPQNQIDFFKNLMATAGDVRLKAAGHNLQTQTIDLSDKRPAETISKPPDTAVPSISAQTVAPSTLPARTPGFGQLPPMPTNLPSHLSCETQENEDGSWVMVFYPNKKPQ
jgi:hypothetical protein